MDDHNNYCRNTASRIYEEEVDENFDPKVGVQNENRLFDDILIDAVKSYPHLYDTSSQDYRDAIKKENSWMEVSRVLNVSPEVCCNRWTRLRESFSKEKKKRVIETKSGSGATKRRGFLHFEAMRFLDKFVKSRSSFNNLKFKQRSSTVPNSQVKDRSEEISDWVQGGISRGQNSSQHQNVLKSIENLATPSTSSSTVTNFQNTCPSSPTSASDYSINNDFSDPPSSSESSSLTIESPLASPTLQASPTTFKKPKSVIKGRFNPYISLKKDEKKKRSENDEFETAFINLNRAVTAHLESKVSEKAPDDADASFCNLIMAEFKAMDEDEKRAKKQEIMHLLWNKKR